MTSLLMLRLGASIVYAEQEAPAVVVPMHVKSVPEVVQHNVYTYTL